MRTSSVQFTTARRKHELFRSLIQAEIVSSEREMIRVGKLIGKARDSAGYRDLAARLRSRIEILAKALK